MLAATDKSANPRIETIGLWLRLCFVTRFAILLGLVPWLLLGTAWFWQPDLMLNAFVLDNPLQLFNLTWLCFLVATFALVAFQIAWLNGRERFGRLPAISNAPPQSRGWGVRWWFFVSVGLPVPAFCLSQIEPTVAWTGLLGPGTAWLAGWGAILLGCLFALVLMFVLVAFQVWLLHPRVCCEGLLPFESWPGISRLKDHRSAAFVWLVSRAAGLLALFGPGYAREVHDEQTNADELVLAPGHAQALLWFGVSLLAYGLSYVLVFWHHWLPGQQASIPAPFFLLMLALLAGTALSGLAFFLDYYRIPVLVTALTVAFSLALLKKTDHYFVLSASLPAAAEPAPDLIQAVGHHKFVPVADRHGGPAQRTLVVVTAAGGGIQAAAWTAEVLTGFDELWGDGFTRSVGLISSVSGGSVGVMYYASCGDWLGAGPVFDNIHRDRGARHFAGVQPGGGHLGPVLSGYDAAVQSAAHRSVGRSRLGGRRDLASTIERRAPGIWPAPWLSAGRPATERLGRTHAPRSHAGDRLQCDDGRDGAAAIDFARCRTRRG